MRVLFFSFIIVILVSAKGTLSGENIENTASIEYSLNGLDYKTQSNTDVFVVDKIVDIKLNWQDSTSVSVSSGEKDRVLTFNLANWGNSKDSITLTNIIDSAKSFSPEPTNIRVFQDSNGNGVFDKDDTIISRIDLDADSNTTLFIVSDIPDGNQSINSEAFVGIKAVSTSKHSTNEDRADKVDVVVRIGEKSEFGIYKIRDCWLETSHSGELIGDDNTTHTGSIIEYKIELSIGGSKEGKEISDINLTDTMPEKTVYIPNSLSLNGKSLKDGEHIEDNIITINNLTLNSNNPQYVVKFRVQVQ